MRIKRKTDLHSETNLQLEDELRPTKVFAKAGQDNVTSAVCYYQQRFGLTFINLAFSC